MTTNPADDQVDVLPSEVSPEIDTLLSDPTLVTLVSGRVVRVERLRTRALMSLLKILTRGASDVLGALDLNEETSSESFAANLLGAIIVAIPEAEDEAIEFVGRMVSLPVKEGRLTKAEAEAQAEELVALEDELEDPDLEDLVSIFEKIISVEAPHMMALGKRLGVLLQAQQKSEAAKLGASSKKTSRG